MSVNKKFGKTTCQGSLKWLELGEVARSRHCSRLASEISFVRYTELDVSNVFACQRTRIRNDKITV